MKSIFYIRIFQYSYKNSLTKNKNGSGSYSFTIENYGAGRCGSGSSLRDEIPQGDVRYDAARKNMGVPWRMFNYDQARELVNNTTYEWTYLNGIYGCKLTSKTDTSKSKTTRSRMVNQAYVLLKQ